MKNPEAAAASQRRSRLANYGLTESGFRGLLDAQQSRCAICDTPLIVGGRGGCKIDHCHETGVVRGILCSACNTGIGHLKDDVRIIRAAASYLLRHQPEGEIGIV